MELSLLVSIQMGNGDWVDYARFAYWSDAEHYAQQVGVNWPDHLVSIQKEGITLYFRGGQEVVAPEEA